MKARTYIGAGMVSLALAGGASAATIDFDAVNAGSFTSITEDGYVLTGVNIKPDSCASTTRRCLGMTAGSSVTMALAAGGTFTLDSLWVKLRGANLLNNLLVTAIGGAGNSYDITASMIGRNVPTTISFGGLFQDVEQIVFSTNGDVRVDDIVATASPVPLPAAGWALFAGMAGLVTLRRKRG